MSQIPDEVLSFSMLFGSKQHREYQEIVLCKWLNPSFGSRVGGQNNVIFSRRIYLKIELSSQRREMAFFQPAIRRFLFWRGKIPPPLPKNRLNAGYFCSWLPPWLRDVTCKPAITTSFRGKQLFTYSASALVFAAASCSFIIFSTVSEQNELLFAQQPSKPHWSCENIAFQSSSYHSLPPPPPHTHTHTHKHTHPRVIKYVLLFIVCVP